MYTNAQMAALVIGLNATLVALTQQVAALSAGTPVAVAAPATIVAAQPIVIPAKGTKAARYACSEHADHKDGKGFSANGIAYHRANGCAGVTTTI